MMTETANDLPTAIINTWLSCIEKLLNFKVLYSFSFIGAFAYLLFSSDWVAALIGAPVLAALLTLSFSLIVFVVGIMMLIPLGVWLLARSILLPLLLASPTTHQSRLP
ncbi:hypothetical protein HG263_21550 [Pseudoalteromonas sp. JBTF-M23]|uniref:Uncharacterized protein n=1 Tax=Pseudoalteromonas caenipelagi TaxID=2726988 RepID=A0A849VH55_9GAMM|nr:hypothetical protein [Pseudoalteromonas caenipelagi]NOU53089.1 hypothetical protein [Pseudoalteromonas caenipelagi]